MKAKRDPRPGWFTPADYAARTRFNLSDWTLMLSRRNYSRVSFDSFYPNGVPEEQKASFWDNYLANVLPCKIGAESDREGSIRWPPPIEDVTTEFFKGAAKLARGLKFQVQALGTRVLAVNTGAPDTVLKTHFHDWLQRQRKRSKLPGKRRGRPSVNFEITDDHIGSWSRYNVLAVLDLDFYAQVFEVKPLTHQQLGEALECSQEVNPRDWGRDARAKAAEAARCLDMLSAQIQAKNSAPAVDRNKPLIPST